jgi:hypothetical protein
MKITPVQVGNLQITDIEPSPISVDFINKTMSWKVIVTGPRIFYTINYLILEDNFNLYIANFTAINFRNYILNDLGLTLL